MKINKKIMFVLMSLVLTSLVSAIPGIPHQFYGSVTVNGQPAPDNNFIVAKIEGEPYATITKDGKYGYAPNIFYVEDPDGDRAGKTISFYVGGKSAGSVVFENNGYTKFDISLTTSCGDGYCLGSETCSSCSKDCGICMDPPKITIHSPEAKLYDTIKINLDVTADQPIIMWLYSLNSDSLITFSPNITLTAQAGQNNLTVVGMNSAFQTGNSLVLFSTSLEYCGDGACNNGETCSTCSGDCGGCSSSSSSGGGGGSSSGGGGGAPKTNNTNILINSSLGENLNNDLLNEDGSINQEDSSEENSTITSSGITGAVIGFARTNNGKVIFGFIAVILIAGIIVAILRKNQIKKEI